MNINTQTLEQLEDKLFGVLVGQRLLRNRLERFPGFLVLFVEKPGVHLL